MSNEFVYLKKRLGVLPVKFGIHTRKKILCNENGKTYNSITECCQDLMIPNSSVSMHLKEKDGYEKVHGYTFKLIN